MSYFLVLRRAFATPVSHIGRWSLVPLLGLALSTVVGAAGINAQPANQGEASADGRKGSLFFDVTQAPFGARADGTFDDTAAVQAAINACDAKLGGTVYFPPGRYLLDSVVLTRPSLTLRGDGHAILIKKGSAPAKQGIQTKAPAAGSPSHVFKDTAGAASGLSCYGLKFDLSRGSFKPGNGVSAFFLIRDDDLRFVDCEFKNGIEEGLKLYKCQNVIIDRCQFENLVDGGVQIHTPPKDGYTGSGPDRDSANIMITRCLFKDIDDGLWGAGNGCGVMMYNSSPDFTTRNVLVQGNIFRGCLNGVWSEAYGQPARRLLVQNNLFVGQYTAATPGQPGGQVAQSAHGVGFVGTIGGSITGNTFFNIGTFAAGPAGSAITSDISAIIISASNERMSSKFVRIADNVIVDDRGANAKMEYGIIVRVNTNLSVGENQIFGATKGATSIARPQTAMRAK
jgi:hypothetical protein